MIILILILECASDSYGQDCNETCGHCKYDHVCNKQNGVCPAGCTSGYYGGKCDTACGNCKAGTVCGEGDGVCPDGCSAGYEGDLCDLGIHISTALIVQYYILFF